VLVGMPALSRLYAAEHDNKTSSNSRESGRRTVADDWCCTPAHQHFPVVEDVFTTHANDGARQLDPQVEIAVCVLAGSEEWGRVTVMMSPPSGGAAAATAPPCTSRPRTCTPKRTAASTRTPKRTAASTRTPTACCSAPTSTASCDAGYVAVTPDHRARVSYDLADDLHNDCGYDHFGGSSARQCTMGVQPSLGDGSGSVTKHGGHGADTVSLHSRSRSSSRHTIRGDRGACRRSNNSPG